ncbi:MAG: cache domain-containing protein [Deltaproteobacteria bacterium]|nr:cache domain-containing protein [Deltaproteobacteria bacterium]
MRLSLLQKAILAVIVILLPIFITFLITYHLNKTQIEQGILEDLTFIAEGYEGQIYQFLEMSKRRVSDFSSDGFIRDQLKKISQGQKSAVEPLNQHLIKNKMPLDKSIQAIYIISLNNRVAASTDPFSVGKYTSIEHFLKSGKTGQTIIESGAGFTGLPDLEISAPITDRITGKLIGIIVNTVQLSELNKIMSGDFAVELGANPQIRGKRKGMEAYLVNKDKLMLTESKFVKDATLNQIVDTAPVRQCLESNTEMTSSYEDYRGIRVIGASMCIPSLKWVLLVEVDEDEALMPLALV